MVAQVLLSAAGARDNLLPDYTGNVGKVLTVNAGATDVEWTTNGAGNGYECGRFWWHNWPDD
jgi:hypothetical protein